MRLLVDAAIAPLSETWHESVRNAETVVAADGTFRESYAPKCFIQHGRGAEVQLDHDGPVIGQVNVVVGSRHQHQHIAEMLIEGDETLLEQRRKRPDAGGDVRPTPAQASARTLRVGDPQGAAAGTELRRQDQAA